MSNPVDQLNNAIAAMGDLATAHQQDRQAIWDLVNTLIPTVSGTLVRDIYVDPNNGDDAGPGSGAAPVRSLKGAAALTSKAGAYNVFLRDDVVVDDRLFFNGTSIRFQSDDPAVQRRMDWANQIDGVETISPCIRASNLSMLISFSDVIFGNTTAAAHVSQRRMIEGSAFVNLHTYQCEFDTNAGHNLPFVVTNSQVSLWMLSATIPPEQAGLWLNNYAANTDPASVPHIINTNLTSL